MKKKYRIKKNEDFQYILNRGKSFANRQLVIYYIRKENQTHFRIGISVGKKLGNAVLRNKIKRYLRESLNLLKDQIRPDVQIIIIARNDAKNKSFWEIQRSLKHVLSKQNLLKK